MGFVDIIPRATEFFGSLQEQMTSGLEGVEAQAQASGEKIQQGLASAFVAIGVAAVAGIGVAVDATVKWGAAVLSVMRVTGLAAGAASVLAATAEKYGVDVTKLNGSLAIFGKNIVSNSAAVAAYNLELTDTNGELLPMDQQLVVVAQRFEELGGAGERGTAFLKTVFGRGGVAMIPVMEAYANGLDEITANAKNLGLYLNQSTIDQTLALSVAWNEAKGSLTGLAVSIGTAFLPVATQLADWFTSAVEWLSGHQAWTQFALDIGLVAGAIGVLAKVVSFVSGIWEHFTALFNVAEVGGTAAVAGAMELSTAATIDLTAVLQRLVAVLALELPAAAGLSADALLGLTGAEVAAGGAATGSAISMIPGAIGAASTGLAVQTTMWYRLGVAMSGVMPKIAAATKLLGLGTAAYVAFQASGNATPFPGSPAAMQGIEDALAMARAGRAGIAAGNPDRSVVGSVGAGFGSEASNEAAIANAKAHAIALGATAAAFDKAIPSGQSYASVLETVVAQEKMARDEQAKGVTAFETYFSKGGAAIQEFAKVSGQSTDGIAQGWLDAQTELDKAAPDMQKVLDDVNGSLAAGKAAWHSYVDSIQQGLNFASTDLAKFSGKANVSVSSLRGALEKSITQTKRFGEALLSISKSGPHGQDVAAYIAQLGPAYAGMAETLVKKNGDVRNSLVNTFSKATNAGQNMAQQIAHAIDPVFEKFLTKLTNIARMIAGLPPLKVDTSSAQGNVDALRNKVEALIAALARVHLPANGLGGANAGGGRGAGWGATGALVRSPTFAMIGEAGPEAVIPLSKMPGASPLPQSPDVSRRSQVRGQVRIADWRNGLLDLDAELSHEYATSGW